MGTFKFFIKPFNDDGTLSSEFIEVTQDVITVSGFNQGIEISDFDVGLIKNTGLTITLRNDLGKYSDAENIRSIFNFKRNGSVFKLLWTNRPNYSQCGVAICGDHYLYEEKNFFEGIINDVSSASNIEEQRVKILALSYESVLNEMLVPFTDLTDGELVSSIIYKCINQAPFNEFVSVLESNINLVLDLEADSVDSLENKTVGEVIGNLLLSANAVLYVKDGVVYVTPREETTDLMYEFFGQGSPRGLENIINSPVYREGINRIFNYWTWASTTLKVDNEASIQLYGVKKKEINLEFITDSTNRTAILTSNNNEFSEPKVEIEIVSAISFNSLSINILDKVSIDYPNVYTPSVDGALVPLYGTAIYGTDYYSFGLWNLTIDRSRRFKVLSKKYDLTKELITFVLREV